MAHDTAPDPDVVLYEIPVTAKRIGVSTRSVYRLIADGTLRAVAPPGSGRLGMRVRSDDLAAYIATYQPVGADAVRS